MQHSIEESADLGMVQMLFTCYCAFIVIMTMRGAEMKLFNLEDLRATLIVRLPPFVNTL